MMSTVLRSAQTPNCSRAAARKVSAAASSSLVSWRVESGSRSPFCLSNARVFSITSFEPTTEASAFSAAVRAAVWSGVTSVAAVQAA